MAKLIRMFAASVGGGLALGAGIRIGSALSRKTTTGRFGDPALAHKVDDLNARLRKVEEEHAASSTERARLNELTGQLRENAEANQKAMLDSVVEGIQARVGQRMSRMEADIANHATAMAELRECSMRTERTLQKLLAGLDRLVAVQLRPEDRDAAIDPDSQAAGGMEEVPQPRRGEPLAVPVRVLRRP